MKTIYTLIFIVLLSVSAWGQSPQKMSYQSIIRNSSNNLVTNVPIGMQISILRDSSNGVAVYVERQFPTTNSNGLASIEIGTGAIVSGNFSSIDWKSGHYFIKTETDLNGGANYTITGTSQLLSVPYALYAENSANAATTSYRNLTNIPTSLDTNRFDDVLTSGNQTISGNKTFTGKVYIDSISLGEKTSKWVFPASNIFVPNTYSGTVSIGQNPNSSTIMTSTTGTKLVVIGFNLPYQILSCPQKIKSVTINYKCTNSNVYISNLTFYKSSKGSTTTIATAATDLTSTTPDSYTLGILNGYNFTDQQIILNINITFNVASVSEALILYEFIIETE